MTVKILKIIILILFLFPLSLIKPVSAFAAATFTLSPATKTASIGENFEVSIILDTGGQATNGGKAVVSFDPLKFSVVDSNLLVTGIQAGPGTVFTTTPTSNTADNTVGKITLDYGTSANTFNGNGVFGKFSLKALAITNSTLVTFLNCSDGTLSCSIYVGTNNVLGTTTGATYAITAAGALGSTATPTPTLASQTATTSSLPVTGVVEDTILLLIFGMMLTLASFFFFKKATV